ncbi:hypothetical protein B0H13DRAFT_1880861 [Mycena leptocephala]|nr:hypothetical protein B0H13DRAFT_1880861 [Mycena leptocephala]
MSTSADDGSTNSDAPTSQRLLLPAEDRTVRDRTLLDLLNVNLMKNWLEPGFKPTAPFVKMVLGAAEGAANILDGTRRPDIQMTDEVCEEFLVNLRDCYKKEKFQWIYDQYWTDRVIYSAELVKIVSQYCDEIEPRLRTFIKEKAPIESWVPDEDTKNSSFLEELHIPLLHGGPDMLLHELGSFTQQPALQKRVENIFTKGRHTLVMLNTSGSGKTRLTLEGLCQFWGLYFTSCVDPQGHGSVDLENAINEIENDKHFTPSLLSTGFEAAQERNRQIAQARFIEVLYARLVIMEIFCRLAKELSSSPGPPPDEYKKYWALLQVKPSLLGGEFVDIFAELSRRIKGTELTHIMDLIEPRRLAFVALLLRTNLLDVPFHYFASLTRHRALRRGLWGHLNRRGPYYTTTNFKGNCCHVGQDDSALPHSHRHGMSKKAVDETMARLFPKPWPHHVLRCRAFDDDKAQIDYMESLMPAGFKGTEEATELFKLTCYWLRGRYRFTAALMRELLLCGFEDSQEVVQQFVFASTAPPVSPEASILSTTRGFKPTGGYLDGLADRNPKRMVKGLKSFKFERLKANANLFKTIKELISKCYMKNRITMELSPDEIEAVEYGFARFAAYVDSSNSYVSDQQKPERVVLDEPLAVLALQQWLGEMDLPVHETIGSKARTGIRRRAIFRFDPANTPGWAKGPAKLISLYKREARWFPNRPRANLESGVVGLARRPSTSLGIGGARKYVRGWLNHDIETPFLFPDINMGPDILFVLELGDEARSRIWVAVQSKYSGADLLVRKALLSAVRSVTPSRFYLGKVFGFYFGVYRY